MDKKDFLANLKKLGACDEAIEWVVVRGGDIATLWNECPRGDWMAWYVAKQPSLCKTTEFYLALADCAYLSLKYFEAKYPNDKRPRDAIKTLRQYARGKATKEQLVAAANAAYAAYAAYDDYDAYAAYDAAYAAYAAANAANAAYAAYAAYDDYDAYANAAANAAADAANAANAAYAAYAAYDDYDAYAAYDAAYAAYAAANAAYAAYAAYAAAYAAANAAANAAADADNDAYATREQTLKKCANIFRKFFKVGKRDLQVNNEHSQR